MFCVLPLKSGIIKRMQAQERIMAKSFSDRFVFYARESKMNGKEKRKTGERSRLEDLSREKEIIFLENC